MTATALPTDKAAELARIEAEIKAHIGDDYKVGQYLLQVQRGKLYNPPYRSLKAYAKTVWKIERTTFIERVDWAAVSEIVGEAKCTQLRTTEGGDGKADADAYEPITKSHARPLAKLMRRDPSLVAPAYEAAERAAAAEGGKVTARLVEDAVRAARRQSDANARQALRAKQSKASKPQLNGRFICADVGDGLDEVEDGTVDLVICSPPYNLGLPYNEWDDLRPRDEYLALLKRWLNVIVQKLNTLGGRLFVNVPAVVGNKEGGNFGHYGFRLGQLVYETVMKGTDGTMNSYQEIVWDTGEASVTGRTWGTENSALLPAVRPRAEMIYGFARGSMRRSRFDPNNDDITPAEFQLWTQNVWTVPPDMAARKKYRHPAPFPVEIPTRIMKLYGQIDDLILDPFGGVGSTALAAELCGRKYVSVDIDQDYTKTAEARVIEAVASQSAKP